MNIISRKQGLSRASRLLAANRSTDGVLFQNTEKKCRVSRLKMPWRKLQKLKKILFDFRCCSLLRVVARDVLRITKGMPCSLECW